MYSDGNQQRNRLDRVIFPEKDLYHFVLGIDRDQRYAPHRPNSWGYYSLPERRIRVNILPDRSASLQLQTATPNHLTNMASFTIDPQGDLRVTNFAMQNSKFIDSSHKQEERPRPRELSQSKTTEEADQIRAYSLNYLQDAWGLTENDIAIPGPELTRRILTAPVEAGLDLKAML